MIPQDFRKMMAKFETTDLFSVAPGRGKELASVEIEEFVALALKEATTESTHGRTSKGRTVGKKSIRALEIVLAIFLCFECQFLSFYACYKEYKA